MKTYAKEHLSDGEDEVKEDNQVAAVDKQQQMSQEEIEKRQLENLPVIADSEISPAAYLF